MKIYIIFALLVATAISFVISRNDEVKTYQSFAELRAALPAIMENNGIYAAINIVDETVQARIISYDDCHLAMHLIGHSAYRLTNGSLEQALEMGSGTQCLGGYMHGLEAEIAAWGYDPQQELEKLCALSKQKNIFGGYCYHGVGHGIFELTHDINRSLAFCESITGEKKSEKDGSPCYRGVFSEVGNVLGGYDTNSGLPIEKIIIDNIDPQNPFLFCDSLSEQYRESCYSQLSKLFYSSYEPYEYIHKCLSPSHMIEAQKICVETLSDVHAKVILSHADTIIAPKIIEGLEGRFRKMFVQGIRRGFQALQSSGQERQWQPFCDSLLQMSDREFCYSL